MSDMDMKADTETTNDGNNVFFWIICIAVLVFMLVARKKKQQQQSSKHANFIPDKFKTYAELQEGLRQAGLESSNLIVGIDFTKSNEWSGAKTFQGENLHRIREGRLNPYQQVIKIVGETLSVFDDDQLIPAFGFGDATTGDRAVFPFFVDHVCHGFHEVLARYNEVAPHVVLSGPTSFAPLIYEAIRIVREAKSYHILVIIADGQVTNEKETTDAIVEASKYPLSIIMVGVGDGPWDTMENYDDGLPQRKFDNFQFVNFHEILTKYDGSDLAFATSAMQEIPDQFKAIRALGYL